MREEGTSKNLLRLSFIHLFQMLSSLFTNMIQHQIPSIESDSLHLVHGKERRKNERLEFVSQEVGCQPSFLEFVFDCFVVCISFRDG